MEEGKSRRKSSILGKENGRVGNEKEGEEGRVEDRWE